MKKIIWSIFEDRYIQVVNVFPSIQSFYKWLSAEEIWKAQTAYLLRKWICKMLYVAHFGFSFKFLGGQKMTFPFLDFSRLFVCPLYALGEPNNTEKVNVAICSHFFLDWLAYDTTWWFLSLTYFSCLSEHS